MYATFDAIAYARKLEQAGFTREQAEIQAENARELREAQAESLRSFTKELDEKTKKELATKGDIQDVRLEIQQTKYDLRKWQIAGCVALAAIMAKGFGWLGF